MRGVLAIRRPSQPDVTQIPTPPLQAAALFINFFLPALALISVALRFYARLLMRQLALDDWLLLVALLFALAMVVPFYFYLKLNYFGWHAKDVPAFDPSPGLWWFYVAQIFYNPVLALVKASVLTFLLRLGGHRKTVRYFIYGLMTFNALQAVAVFLVAVFQCTPIEANWEPRTANDHCINPVFHVIVSSITVATDLLVLLIPFWIFLGLKLPLAAKVAIIGIFLTGLAVTIISAVRLADIYKLFFVKPDPNKDPYFDIGVTLNVLEINLAIVSAAAPALRPIFRKWFPGLFGTSKRYPPPKTPYRYDSDNRYVKGTDHSGSAVKGNERSGIPLKSMGKSMGMGRAERGGHTEIRSVSPSASEEEIMTSNGIMRTTDVQIHYGSRHDVNKTFPPSTRDYR